MLIKDSLTMKVPSLVLKMCTSAYNSSIVGYKNSSNVCHGFMLVCESKTGFISFQIVDSIITELLNFQVRFFRPQANDFYKDNHVH